jgi:hypothetical protein
MSRAADCGRLLVILVANRIIPMIAPPTMLPKTPIAAPKQP